MKRLRSLSPVRASVMAAAIAVAALSAGSPARAQSPAAAAAVAAVELTPPQERRAASLYEELKCPVCKNQSLAASSSFLAEEMKVQIREMVAAGQSNQAILDYYVDRYGRWILLRPPAEGTGLLAWGLPIGGVLVAAAGVLLALRVWSRQGGGGAAEADVAEAPVDARDRQRIDDLVAEGDSREA